MTYVLMVDDEDDLRELLVELLADAGYRATAARGGDEALRLMRASPPSLVVMDLMMPLMNGYQLAAEMERDPQLSQIPFCVITASTFQQPPARAACVLHKPFRSDEFLDLVGRCITRTS